MIFSLLYLLGALWIDCMNKIIIFVFALNMSFQIRQILGFMPASFKKWYGDVLSPSL